LRKIHRLGNQVPSSGASQFEHPAIGDWLRMHTKQGGDRFQLSYMGRWV
jgi:hypothetical protein